MKPHVKRLWGVLAGAVIALSVTPTLVAHAADMGPDYDNVSTTGTTTFTAAVPLVGGAGTWTFRSSGPCAEVSGGVEVNTTEVVETGTTCTVTGTGTYASIVCGTMTIAGTFNVTLTVTQPFTATETWTTTFTAVIANGSGPINGTSVEGTSSDGENDGGRAWTTTGQVMYQPNSPPPPPPACMATALTSLSLHVAEQ